MKFLILGNQLLYPADTGGKIRSSSLFERLKRDHEITMVVYRRPEETDEQVALMEACCHRLETVPWTETKKRSWPFYRELAANLWSPLPYIVWKYDRSEMRARLAQLAARLQPDLFLCDFLQPSANCLDLDVRPKILFQHNVEAVIRRRQAEQARGRFSRMYWDLQTRRLQNFERNSAMAFDHCIMVSPEDCETMAKEYGYLRTSAVPLGVDVEYFAPDDTPPLAGRAVFTGSMDWLPNEDAVEWYVREILPLIRREAPEASLAIVGRRPSPKVESLAAPGVLVTGTVPDIRPYLREAEVYVVPLRIGGGTRIKIFEAMAAGCAVVSTTIGAEGLPVEDGVDIILADTPEALAAAVLRVQRDRELRSRLGAAARRKVAEEYSWEHAARVFAEQCEAVVAKVRSKP